MRPGMGDSLGLGEKRDDRNNLGDGKEGAEQPGIKCLVDLVGHGEMIEEFRDMDDVDVIVMRVQLS